MPLLPFFPHAFSRSPAPHFRRGTACQRPPCAYSILSAALRRAFPRFLQQRSWHDQSDQDRSSSGSAFGHYYRHGRPAGRAHGRRLRLWPGAAHECGQLLVFRQNRAVHVPRAGAGPGRSPGPAQHGGRAGPECRHPQAPHLRGARSRAQRLCYGAQPGTRRGGRDGRHHAPALARGTARGAGARNGAHQKPRHPHPDHCRGHGFGHCHPGQYFSVHGHFRRQS